MSRTAIHVGAVLLAASIATAAARDAQPRFFPDDPLPREPDSQDASGVQAWDIDFFHDMVYQLFVTPRLPVEGIRAGNVNTVDEVPDSSWFTNRVGWRPVTLDELRRGPNVGPPPDATQWTLVREKTSGFSPGFTARDAAGQTWFLTFDSPTTPEGGTGALMVASRLFWALGYNQVEYFLTEVDPSTLAIDPGARTRRPSGVRTPVRRADVNAVFERSARPANGRHRAAAGRLLPGRILGGFRYEGTRPDDPNDIVPHQHRRELRALRVFGAWTNLTDMKAGNTLDTLITEHGRGVVKHVLQDVGSTFGVGALGPHDWNEGHEFLWDGRPALRRLLTFGFAFSPWQRVPYEERPAVGRFSAEHFDPDTWKPHAPTRAYFELRDDDAFWAARRVMAFSDDAIRAIVGTGGFSDPEAARVLAEVLMARRDIIGRTYLPRVNPIVAPALTADALDVRNAAVEAGVATAPVAYRAAWSVLDNATGRTTALAETRSDTSRLPLPAGLPSSDGAFVCAALSSEHPDHPSWARPVDACFRKEGTWRLVGLDRIIDGSGRAGRRVP